MPNQTLHLTAFPIRSIEAGELGRCLLLARMTALKIWLLVISSDSITIASCDQPANLVDDRSWPISAFRFHDFRMI
jgi:hypothetical protein